MVFGIDDIHVAVWTDGNAFGPVERRHRGTSAVAGVSFLSSAGDVVEQAIGKVQPPDAVSFAKRDPELIPLDEQCPRTNHWLAGGRLAIDWLLALAVASNRRDDAGFRLDSADAVVGDIGDVEIVLAIQGNAMRAAELGLDGGASVAAESRFARAGDRAD